MGKPHRLTLRSRIVNAYKAKEGSIRALAKRFAVAPNTVQNYLTLLKETGSLAPRPHGGGVTPRINDQQLEDVRLLIQQMPDATQDELAKAFAQRHHLPVSRSTMWRALRRARACSTLKKKPARLRA